MVVRITRYLIQFEEGTLDAWLRPLHFYLSVGSDWVVYTPSGPLWNYSSHDPVEVLRRLAHIYDLRYDLLERKLRLCLRQRYRSLASGLRRQRLVTPSELRQSRRQLLTAPWRVKILHLAQVQDRHDGVRQFKVFLTLGGDEAGRASTARLFCFGVEAEQAAQLCNSLALQFFDLDTFGVWLGD